MPFIPFSIAERLVFLQVEPLAETLHAPRGVKDTLLAGEEWVAPGAHINLEHRLDANGLKAIATGAAYCGLNIFWMDSLFHD